MIFVVTSCREYADDERYFGCDGLFKTEAAARKYINDDMNQTLDTCSDEAWVDGFEIHDGSDLYVWTLEPLEVKE